MARATPTPGQPLTRFVARLVDATGCHSPATSDEVARDLRAGTFVWLDLENPQDDQLREFGDALQFDKGTIDALPRADQRPSFTPVGDSIWAGLPAADDSSPTMRVATFVSVVFTKRYLFTLHTAPCPPLAEARDRYSVPHARAITDAPQLLFLVLDSLIDSFEPEILALDKRLDEIQWALLAGSPPKIHEEIIGIRRIFTEAMQALAWYANDLQDLAGGVDSLPAMSPGAEAYFDRHLQRVQRLRRTLKDHREEANEALDQYASNIADRQGQLINVLTVVSTILLPLTVITGFFGMNFDVITQDLRTNLEFILLGVMFPALTVVAALLLYRRLVRRLGVRSLSRPPTTLDRDQVSKM